FVYFLILPMSSSSVLPLRLITFIQISLKTLTKSRRNFALLMLKIQAKIFEKKLKISFERLCEFSVFYEILRNSRIPKNCFWNSRI
ncbi:MAG: hypothetical protein MSS71_03635, partial [Campylobacter sp.]|uniref:hypothetical protein n=1 Tax=Campylobacter sp. TaxID=205 RepID=UPI002AA6B5E4